MVIGMAISVLVKALLPGGGRALGGKPTPPQEIRHKIGRRVAQYPWSDHQLGTHEAERGSGLGCPKSVDAGYCH